MHHGTQVELLFPAITILQKHLEFLISRHAHIENQDTRPVGFGDMFSTDWTRDAISRVVAKGIGHLTEVHICDISSLLVSFYSVLFPESSVVGCTARLGD